MEVERGHPSLQCCGSASSVLAVGVSRLPNCALLKSQASEQRRRNAQQGQGQGETGLADPEWGGPFPPREEEIREEETLS